MPTGGNTTAGSIAVYEVVTSRVFLNAGRPMTHV